MSGVATRYALEAVGLTKAFGGAVALDQVDLRVRPGEILALLGQNGSGKSTLVKCLTGVYTPDEGSVSVHGHPLHLPAVAPHAQGIAVIHQDVGMVEDLTVIENLGVSVGYGTRLFGVIRERAERERFRAIMERIGVIVPLDARVGDLSPAERSLLAVIRAIRLMEDSGRAPDQQVFILDEPTAALSAPEAEKVLDLMSRMAAQGAGVVFISHRIAEVMRVCDHVVVLRAGKKVHSGPVSALTRSELVATMLGRRMEDFYPAPPPRVAGAEVRLAVQGLSTDRLRDVSFTVSRGEVVGVTGLAGMGQEELPNVLFGAVPARAGTVMVDGGVLRGRGPREAVARGMALVPSDRLRDGCWADGSAGENVTLTSLRDVLRHRILDKGAEEVRARDLMTRFGVVPSDPTLPMTGFSGGNQQKVVFAKWVQLAPDVLLLDEPTQGVDPGAARDLLAEAMTLAEAGAAVVVFSGDHEQIAEICHRVLVLQHGEVVSELTGDELTEQAVLAACER